MDSTNRLDGDGSVVVRTLKRTDLERLVRIDERWVGRNRRLWLQGKLERALDSDVLVSLGAEIDGTVVGAILGTVQFGEFGRPEPIAVLDTLLVDPDFLRRGVGTSLMAQLLRNLRALRVDIIRTEVGWAEREILDFLAAAGFEPVPRLVLERRVETPR